MYTKKLIVVALAGALAACGGGGDSSTPASTSTSGSTSGSSTGGSTVVATTLTGTAAIGQPIVGTVVAVDVNGKVSPAAITTALGAFVVDVAGMTAPFILSVTGTADGKLVNLNSVATAAGQTVNITPLTDLIVSTAAGQPAGSTLASLCAPVASVVSADCTAALKAATTATRLDAAVTAVSAMIKPLNPTDINPLTGAFVANGSGMDAVLDQILVSPAAAQQGMATVTLIATNTALGQMTLPATAGQVATSSASTLSTAQVAQAAAAATVLPEIRACLASFSALYPATNFTAPSTSAVTAFIDSSFGMGRLVTQSAFASALSDPNEMAIAGLVLDVAGLAPYDMSPLTAVEASSLSTLTVVEIVKARASSAIGFNASGAPVSAWIRLHPGADAGLMSFKMVKGAAYAGCPGGWKSAGSKHLDMHMNARISRSLDASGTATITRQWAFHIEKGAVAAEVAAGSPAIDTVIVKGPGLSLYSGDKTAPVGVSQRLVLGLPTGLDSAMRIVSASSFYGNSDALQSCQDLASTSAAAGTPCIDETQAGSNKLYSWVLLSGGVNGTVVAAFPFQVNAVPLSKAFATANQASLFATLTKATPSGIGALNSLLAGYSGSVLDNVFTFTYTQSATYGSRMDNCHIGFFDASGVALLRAEQNAVGRETSCTFNTTYLNSGSLNKPAGVIASGFISLSTSVLGNQASSGQSF